MNDPAASGASAKSRTLRQRVRTITTKAAAKLQEGALGKLARAKVRHKLLTVVPDRLTGGALRRAHLLRSPELREVSLSVAGWPASFDGVRIAHLSDLHVGDLMPVRHVAALARRLRATRPDLLVCTGDVVDLHVHGAQPAGPALEALGEIGAALGAYLVLGNHDHLDNPAEVIRLAHRAGFAVVEGRVHAVQPPGTSAASLGDLRIGGVEWASTIRQNQLNVQALCAGREVPHLLLAHNPKAFRGAARRGIPLTLAGHTHGGQVRLAPAGRVPRRGHSRDGDSHLYVTTGVGAWFPLRVNCPSEVAMITVRCA